MEERVPTSVSAAIAAAGSCPDCGGRLSGEHWSEGLCPSCLLSLGLSARSRVEPEEGENRPTLGPMAAPFTAGQVLGDRYRVRALLGRGGMGEVFRAIDLKLRVDVALKAVRPVFVADERARRALREEVRAARQVVSPNVCRVFDLVEVDGRELVSMEFVDGVTLAEVLRDRSPLGLQDAREIASQFLAGLEAIHAAGLVHRDIKPENVMLTRAGRVVVMDFGIARALDPVRGGTISGTPAYMSPEQARGETVDARADVFSAGVVLAELVAPGGARHHPAREAVWRGVHDQPPRLDDTPWAPVLRKAVAPTRDHRHATASALSRALDEVTLRSIGGESERPYPGLASFTERDAGYFVGRELEIEEMWKKLRRPHLLALIGPSGAGKSSFLRAGLGASAPPGWRVVFATPSNRPFAALAHALAPELAGDAEAVARLIDFERPGVAVELVSHWRRRHDHALLVIDQFEELFTQSPPAAQQQFAAMLARLPLEANVHVLLSLRDDFLFHCHALESLAPIFSELTAIGPPTGAALRRALVQPALKCGYRFEDETMVDEILAEVAGERAALPLVAFAMARLWDERDREKGLLTRGAYHAMGGVAGALAQHAEATLERIGQDRVPIVREIFRNLVTAQGTRATLDRDDLLSVFGSEATGEAAGSGPSGRQQAAEVLDALVDARLLTSYEPPSIEPEAEGHRRIEIVHESLLSSWPRLVRWQTQDQDGAQLRDQLRQAARLWEERGKPEDLLWTGTSFREYELWRERYAGKLSASEDTFVGAMTARALRRKRQRRMIGVAVMAAALLVAVAMTLLWRQSEGARAQAIEAARHAEAQQLFALGQVELQQNPTAALAYALASLERADSAHARRFALQALWHGPIGFRLSDSVDPAGGTASLSFTDQGDWFAVVNQVTGTVRLWKSDGSTPREIPGSGAPGNFAWGEFSEDGQSLVVTQSDSIRIHPVLAGGPPRRIEGTFRWGLVRGQSVITASFLPPGGDGRPRRLMKQYPLPEGTPDVTLGIHTFPPGTPGGFTLDHTGHFMLGLNGGALFEMPLRQMETARARLVVAADGIEAFAVSPDSSRAYTWNKSRIGRVWALRTGASLPGPNLTLPADQSHFGSAISKDGRWMAIANGTTGVQMWDLAGPVDVDPVIARAGTRTLAVAITPDNTWLATHDHSSLTMWPVDARRAYVLRAPESALRDVTMDPRGEWVAAGGQREGSVWVWPMRTNLGRERSAHRLGPSILRLAVSPRGDRIAAGTVSGVWLIPLDGGKPERLPNFSSFLTAVAFDGDGRRLAAAGGLGGELHAPGEAIIRVWNAETRETQTLDAHDGQGISDLAFMPDGRLLSSGQAGLRIWDLATKTSTHLVEGTARALGSADGRFVLGLRAGLRPGGIAGTAFILDLEHKKSWDLASHGSEVTSIGWIPNSTQIVTGSRDGIVRVGAMSGDEPHLLVGHAAPIWNVDVGKRGQWIASTGDDGTVRVWPVPEGRPFHTLPYNDLLNRIRGLTNYRVVADPGSSSGYRLGAEPFTGWNRKPPQW